MNELDQGIKAALGFLQRNQMSTGEFSTIVSRRRDMQQATYRFSTFISTFVLHALSHTPSSFDTQTLKERAISFLQGNQEGPGLCRFFGRGSSIVPDLDSTACCLAALAENNVEIHEDVTSYLLRFQTDEGPFLTWMNSDLSWLQPGTEVSLPTDEADQAAVVYSFFATDVDWVVNANVLFFYALCGWELSEVGKYLNHVVAARDFQKGTRYYPSSYAFMYTLTRAFADGNASILQTSVPLLRDFILENQQADGSWGDNELDNALAATSLLNIHYQGEEVDGAIRYILERQEMAGNWQCAPFFRDMTRYYGASALTTAICLESLSKYSGT